jgi:hypothetical protein
MSTSRQTQLHFPSLPHRRHEVAPSHQQDATARVPWHVMPVQVLPCRFCGGELELAGNLIGSEQFAPTIAEQLARASADVQLALEVLAARRQRLEAMLGAL